MGVSLNKFLIGAIKDPDLVTIVTQDARFTDKATRVHRLNTLGYIPVVSTVTGMGRALLGLVYTVAHLAYSVFCKDKNCDDHLAEAKLGAKSIARGLVEMIPVIGNITMVAVDVIRTRKYDKLIDQQMAKNPKNYMDRRTHFYNGQEIAQYTLDGVRVVKD